MSTPTPASDPGPAAAPDPTYTLEELSTWSHAVASVLNGLADKREADKQNIINLHGCVKRHRDGLHLLDADRAELAERVRVLEARVAQMEAAAVGVPVMSPSELMRPLTPPLHGDCEDLCGLFTVLRQETEGDRFGTPMRWSPQ